MNEDLETLLLVLAEMVYNFQKQKTNNLNTPYDYSSVMHYGR